MPNAAVARLTHRGPPESASPAWPATLAIDTPTRVVRWRPLVQWLLAVPHLVVLAVLAGASVVAALVSWVTIVVTGRLPAPLANFQTRYLRYSARVNAYAGFLVDDYPPFDLGGGPARVRADFLPELDRRERLSVLLRAVLLIPQMVVLVVLHAVAMLAWLVGLVAVVVTGRWPPRVRDVVVGVVRWSFEVSAYALLLTDRRPPFDRHQRERLMRIVFLDAALASLVISAMILIALFTNGWEFLSQVEWSTVFTDTWNPRSDGFSITTLLVGSLVVTGVAMVVAVPLGLGAAVYLSEYSSRRVRATLKPILEVLAGIPSVVLGFFALTWIAPNIVGPLFGQDRGSMLAAGIGVGVLSIPLVASVAEDAMRSVPDSLREASAGLGARKRSTTTKIVLPAAVSGIVAAVILAVSRAVGETMVVFIAGGAADTATFTADPREGTLTMTAAMASLATGTDQVRGGSLAVPSLYFVGIVLFVCTLGLNVIAERFVRRVRQAY